MANGGRKVKPALPELGLYDHFDDSQAYPEFVVVACGVCRAENVSAEPVQLQPGEWFACVDCGNVNEVPEYDITLRQLAS